VEGEAAFYGPKVDFMIRSVVGTEYAISTNQLDFVAAQRFNLTYQSADGKEEPVYVIHRAPLGSHERFTAFLIEHYGGKFPTWLSPVQAVVIPISERHDEYARSVRDQLNALAVDNGTGGLRVEADLSGERMQKKILKAQHEYVPYMLVAGDREVEAGAVAVRTRKGTDLGQMPVEKFVERVKAEIACRRDLPDA
jgi:threonyl-tRNA synthetase